MKKSNSVAFFRIFFYFILIFYAKNANSTESFDKYWSVAVVTGSFSDQSPFKYYLEPQLRLIDDPVVFNQLLLLSGVGYQINPDFLILFGPGWVLTETVQQDIVNENRLWEQVNWRIKNSSNLSINSRTRLEERKIYTSSAVATRFRERMWIKIPIKNLQRYALSFFDEIFLNLNNVPWASPYLIEQNRAFAGISIQLSKSTVMDFGYLNQYIHSLNNEFNNVLWLSFTVTS